MKEYLKSKDIQGGILVLFLTICVYCYINAHNGIFYIIGININLNGAVSNSFLRFAIILSWIIGLYVKSSINSYKWNLKTELEWNESNKFIKIFLPEKYTSYNKELDVFGVLFLYSLITITLGYNYFFIIIIVVLFVSLDEVNDKFIRNSKEIINNSISRLIYDFPKFDYIENTEKEDLGYYIETFTFLNLPFRTSLKSSNWKKLEKQKYKNDYLYNLISDIENKELKERLEISNLWLNVWKICDKNELIFKELKAEILLKIADKGVLDLQYFNNKENIIEIYIQCICLIKSSKENIKIKDIYIKTILEFKSEEPLVNLFINSFKEVLVKQKLYFDKFYTNGENLDSIYIFEKDFFEERNYLKKYHKQIIEEFRLNDHYESDNMHLFEYNPTIIMINLSSNLQKIYKDEENIKYIIYSLFNHALFSSFSSSYGNDLLYLKSSLLIYNYLVIYKTLNITENSFLNEIVDTNPYINEFHNKLINLLEHLEYIYRFQADFYLKIRVDKEKLLLKR